MTVEQLRRAVENHIGPETRLPGFLSIAAHALSRIRAFGDRRDGWSFDFTKAAFNTEAAYETGTIAVNQSSTSVTGSGTTWTGITNTRHKMLIGGVAYPITTIGGNTSITLTSAFAGASISGEAYSIVLDEYSLPAMTSLWGVWDASQDNALCGIPRTLLHDHDVTRNAAPGNPTHYAIIGRGASNVPLLQLYPAPASIARIEYWYQADYTRITGIGDTIDLPSQLDAAIIQGAIARSDQTLRRDGSREEMATFEQMILEAWFADRPQRDAKVRMMRTDGYMYRRLDLPGWQEVVV